MRGDTEEGARPRAKRYMVIVGVVEGGLDLDEVKEATAEAGMEGVVILGVDKWGNEWCTTDGSADGSAANADEELAAVEWLLERVKALRGGGLRDGRVATWERIDYADGQ